MSSVGIIVAIAVILSILVCGAFIAQTIQQRREQHNRLLAALRAKSRRFKMILAGCPKGFLSRDLTILVLRSLIDANEKLSRLEPSQSSHTQDIKLFSAELSEAQHQTAQPDSAPITNPLQMQELKACLEELGRYIANLETKQALPVKQTNIFKAQIKYLMFKLTIESNELQAQNAQENNKPRLALHHYEIAFNLIMKNAKGSALEAKLPKLEERLRQLKEAITIQEGTNKQTQGPENQRMEVNHEWDNFGEENSWKKKNIYD